MLIGGFLFVAVGRLIQQRRWLVDATNTAFSWFFTNAGPLKRSGGLVWFFTNAGPLRGLLCVLWFRNNSAGEPLNF